MRLQCVPCSMCVCSLLHSNLLLHTPYSILHTPSSIPQGILLYALLCGCFPFRAKAYPDLYRRIARGTFPIPEELSAPVKDLLRQVCIMYYMLYVIYYVLYIIYYLLFIIYYVLCIMYCPPFMLRHMPYAIQLCINPLTLLYTYTPIHLYTYTPIHL
jgi:hypothetical protein